MVNIHPDVSRWQAEVSDGFTRRFLMFRALTEHGAIDSVAEANLAWAVRARAAGKLDNFGFYVIPGFVSNDTIMRGLDALGLPRDCVGMVDWETWSGKLSGDHSAGNNDLATRIRNRQSGRPDLAWGYSNRGDLAAWPQRPSWLGMVIAGYGSNDPRDEGIGNVIGWQYTNGTENHTIWPSSTPPFGRCDHNVMFIDYPKPGTGGLVSEEYDALRAQISALHDKLGQELATQDQISSLKHQLQAQAALLAAQSAARDAATRDVLSQLAAGGQAIDYARIQQIVHTESSNAARTALEDVHIEVSP